MATEQETKAGAISDVCVTCGANARPGSQFCYNCGGSLAVTAELSAGPSAGDLALSTNGGAKADEILSAGPGLRSAASLTKEPKAFQRKPIQIIWEPSDSESNILLVLTAVLVLVFALGAVGLALYFK